MNTTGHHNQSRAHAHAIINLNSAILNVGNLAPQAFLETNIHAYLSELSNRVVLTHAEGIPPAPAAAAVFRAEAMMMKWRNAVAANAPRRIELLEDRLRALLNAARAAQAECADLIGTPAGELLDAAVEAATGVV